MTSPDALSSVHQVHGLSVKQLKLILQHELHQLQGVCRGGGASGAPPVAGQGR